MFAVVTQFIDKPVSVYQIDDENSAMYLGRQIAQHEGVLETTVFRTNPMDPNGVGSMVHVATFGHNFNAPSCEGHGVIQRNGICTNCDQPV